jgi:hypothetical protein
VICANSELQLQFDDIIFLKTKLVLNKLRTNHILCTMQPPDSHAKRSSMNRACHHANLEFYTVRFCIVIRIIELQVNLQLRFFQLQLIFLLQVRLQLGTIYLNHLI